jgi:DNA-directed RNA polymerase subunit RPC12/RpoP
MTDDDAQPCAVCDKPARERVHRGCRERIEADLRELPQLYRQLGPALIPGRRGGDGRNATRTAPLPCSIDALDLVSRGGIEGVVGGWARDLCEREQWDIPHFGTVTATVDWACGILGLNLALLCDEHPAIRELADEVRAIAGQARRIITGEKPPRKVGVSCHCGRTLKITLDTAGVRCPDCSAQYGHSEALQLPLAERQAA